MGTLVRNYPKSQPSSPLPNGIPTQKEEQNQLKGCRVMQQTVSLCKILVLKIQFPPLQLLWQIQLFFSVVGFYFQLCSYFKKQAERQCQENEGKKNTQWENECAKDTSDKRLLPKIYKELLKLHNKKMNNLIKQWAKKTWTPH